MLITMDISREKLIVNIEARLDGLKLEAATISKKIGGPDVIRDIYRSKSRFPRLDRIAMLAREMRCSIADLLYGDLKNLKNPDYESRDVYNWDMFSGEHAQPALAFSKGGNIIQPDAFEKALEIVNVYLEATGEEPSNFEYAMLGWQAYQMYIEEIIKGENADKARTVVAMNFGGRNMGKQHERRTKSRDGGNDQKKAKGRRERTTQ